MNEKLKELAIFFERLGKKEKARYESLKKQYEDSKKAFEAYKKKVCEVNEVRA